MEDREYVLISKERIHSLLKDSLVLSALEESNIANKVDCGIIFIDFICNNFNQYQDIIKDLKNEVKLSEIFDKLVEKIYEREYPCKMTLDEEGKITFYNNGEKEEI